MIYEYRFGIRWLKKFVLIGVMIAVHFADRGCAIADDRPNFLIILCDDLGWGDLQCYGHPVIKTPHLKRLADQGLRLTRCYSAAPVCSPSRAGLMTGRNPNRAGIYDWIPDAKAGAETARQKVDSRQLVHLRRSESTLPGLLKKAGYATAMSGKWHCNSMFNHPEQPQPGDAGFEHWFATQNNAGPSHKDPRNFVRNGENVGELKGFSSQLVADEAITWLESQTKTGQAKPFFLYVAFHEPHEPVASPPELVESYERLGHNHDQSQYFANVQNMDTAVGSLMEALDRLQLANNTLVFFSSDNGPETLSRYPAAKRSYGTPGALQGMKLWTTEAGIRVAGILRWPGQIEAGKTSDIPVSSLDMLPTMGKLGNAEVDSSSLDGTDIRAMWKGGSFQRNKPLFWFYYNAINEQRAAMIDGPWKLLAKFDGGNLPLMANVSRANRDSVQAAKLTDFSLYNLDQDKSEKEELNRREPEQLQKMIDLMESTYRELVTTMHVW